MANTLKHLRSGVAGVRPTLAQLEIGQIAINYKDKALFIQDDASNVVVIATADSVTAGTTAVQTVNGKAGTAIVLAPTDIGTTGVAPLDGTGKVALSNLPTLVQSVNGQSGIAVLTPADIGTYGVAPLDVTGKVPIVNLPDAVLGSVHYMGTWDASLNSPLLPDPTTVTGHYYITSVAGTQFTLNFTLGDWVISDGTKWDKVDAVEGVTSVAGKAGAVVLAAGDIASGVFDSARLGSGNAANLVLTTDASGNPVWADQTTVGKGGTVTSVDVVVPAALLSVSGGPVTTTGSITLALPVRTANTVFAGPANGADTAPNFRALVGDDIPVIDAGTF